MAHVLGMFVPSIFTGFLIVRFGAERIIRCGVAYPFARGWRAFDGADSAAFLWRDDFSGNRVEFRLYRGDGDADLCPPRIRARARGGDE